MVKRNFNWRKRRRTAANNTHRRGDRGDHYFTLTGKIPMGTRLTIEMITHTAARTEIPTFLFYFGCVRISKWDLYSRGNERLAWYGCVLTAARRCPKR